MFFAVSAVDSFMKRSRRIAGAGPEIQVDFSGRVTPESARTHSQERRESVSSDSDAVFEMAPTPAETAASKMEIRATARKDALAQAVTQLETYVTSYEGATGDDKIAYLAKARSALEEGKAAMATLLDHRDLWEEKAVDAFHADKDRLQAALTAVATFYSATAKQYQKLLVLEETSKHMFSKSSANKIKMPELKMDTFSGAIEDYYSFRSLFHSIVAKQSDATDATKLHFLKGQLKDKAKEAVAMVGNSDADYQLAWQLLDTRFGCKQAIVDKLITDIRKKATEVEEKGRMSPLEQRKVHYEIRGMWQKLILADEVLGKEDASFRNLIPKFYTFSIKKDIEERCGISPSVNDFLKVANDLVERDVRLSGAKEKPDKKQDNGAGKKKGGSQDGGATAALAGAVQAAGGGASKGGKGGSFGGAKMKSGNNGKGWNPQQGGGAASANEVKAQDNTCKVCNTKGHHVAGCQVFQKLSLEKKQEACRKNRLCWRCLREGHMGRQCKWAKPCKMQDDGKECGLDNHHALLHRPPSK